MTSPAIPRRAIAAALLAAPALWLGPRAQAAAARIATPSQTEGPFYPVSLPDDADHDLLRNGRLIYGGGQPAWVEGTVTDLAGRPVRGAQVEIWQSDAAGHYHHPGDWGRADAAFQGFGRVPVAHDGTYRFRTIRPVPYAGRTSHVHFKVRLGQRELLTTQLYVAGDAGNASDPLWRELSQAERRAVTVPFAPGADGLQAQFPIVIAL